MFAKMVLPLLGGAPAVWNASSSSIRRRCGRISLCALVVEMARAAPAIAAARGTTRLGVDLLADSRGGRLAAACHHISRSLALDAVGRLVRPAAVGRLGQRADAPGMVRPHARKTRGTRTFSTRPATLAACWPCWPIPWWSRPTALCPNSVLAGQSATDCLWR